MEGESYVNDFIFMEPRVEKGILGISLLNNDFVTKRSGHEEQDTESRSMYRWSRSFSVIDSELLLEILGYKTCLVLRDVALSVPLAAEDELRVDDIGVWRGFDNVPGT